jgi:DNA-3-methyladenine glycosylase II
MSKILIPVPDEFSFEHTLSFLTRSPRELLHRADHEQVTKLLKFGNESVLFKVTMGKRQLVATFLHGDPSAEAKAYVKQYIAEWLDLQTDLKPFYRFAAKDHLLKSLVKKYYGYRIVGQPDLYESLTWAVLGQQINLAFAYTLKQRFVESYGSRIDFEGTSYHLFPEAASVRLINPDDLLKLQFSRQKSNYTINIAEAFVSGLIVPEKLRQLPLTEAKAELMKIKGIGNWTANYALMKSFRHPDAFPLEDAGVHNAIRNQLKLKEKPDLEKIRRIFKKYKGWEAYATLYLWKSL